MRYKSQTISIMAAAILFLGSMPVRAGSMYTTEGVHVRSQADKKSDIVITLPGQTKVEKTGAQGNWIKVSYDGKNGYIYKDYLSKNKIDDTSKEESNQKSSNKSQKENNSRKETKVNATEVNLRKKPNGEILRVMDEGETVYKLSTKGEWTKVETTQGEKGYIYSDYLGTRNKISRSDQIYAWKEKAVDYAYDHLDDIYSQEKRDMEGYADCSSLVRNAYRHAANAFIGNTTVTQTEDMEDYLYEIDSIYDVSFGDIVYHLSGDNHAGIYVGNGKVIHASQKSGYVKISTYGSDSTYWEYGCKAAAYCYDQP